MTTEVDEILARARERGHQRAANSPKPDYRAARPVFARQKAALTRAVNSKDPEKVILACRKVVDEWSKPPFDGAWPDDWSRWQRALDDVLPWSASVRLEDLD
jgi:hypothetical protein